jgi:hypothetical protein
MCNASVSRDPPRDKAQGSTPRRYSWPARRLAIAGGRGRHVLAVQLLEELGMLGEDATLQGVALLLRHRAHVQRVGRLLILGLPQLPAVDELHVETGCSSGFCGSLGRIPTSGRGRFNLAGEPAWSLRAEDLPLWATPGGRWLSGRMVRAPVDVSGPWSSPPAQNASERKGHERGVRPPSSAKLSSRAADSQTLAVTSGTTPTACSTSGPPVAGARWRAPAKPMRPRALLLSSSERPERSPANEGARPPRRARTNGDRRAPSRVSVSTHRAR